VTRCLTVCLPSTAPPPRCSVDSCPSWLVADRARTDGASSTLAWPHQANPDRWLADIAYAHSDYYLWWCISGLFVDLGQRIHSGQDCCRVRPKLRFGNPPIMGHNIGVPTWTACAGSRIWAPSWASRTTAACLRERTWWRPAPPPPPITARTKLMTTMLARGPVTVSDLERYNYPRCTPLSRGPAVSPRCTCSRPCHPAPPVRQPTASS
jgi:hypothetical protein